MRRKERDVSGMQNILAIVQRCQVLRLGLSNDNKPYIVPLNFGYALQNETLCFYFHGAPAGKKFDYIEQNSRACFELDYAPQIVLAKNACACTCMYQSVMGEGAATLLCDDDEKIAGLDIIMAHCGFAGKPSYGAMLKKVAVWKLEVTQISAKVHEVL